MSHQERMILGMVMTSSNNHVTVNIPENITIGIIERFSSNKTPPKRFKLLLGNLDTSDEDSSIPVCDIFIEQKVYEKLMSRLK
jgi:hypothetical protein